MDYMQSFLFQGIAVRGLTHSVGGAAQLQVPPPAAAQRQVLQRSQRSTHNFPAACPRDDSDRCNSFTVHESFSETEFRTLIFFRRREGLGSPCTGLFRGSRYTTPDFDQSGGLILRHRFLSNNPSSEHMSLSKSSRL